jgi:hypothetical protein
MKKIKVTLTLDREIVKLAKEFDLNISQISNEALKSRLLPIISGGERLLINFEGVLKQIGYYSLPFPIRKVKLRNIAKLKKVELEFTYGINMLYGPWGSGKRSIIKAIIDAFSFVEEVPVRMGTNSAEVEVEVIPSKTIKVKYKKIGNFVKKSGKVRCVLLRNPVDQTAEYFKIFIKNLRRTFSECQIIMPVYREDVLKYADNFINLGEIV